MRAHLALTLLCGSMAAQAAQLVGPVINASAIIRATPGFSGATSFRGACRDSQGNYWTTCWSNNQRFLVRISPSLLVTTGFIPSAGPGVHDLACDTQRNRIWVAPGCDVYDSISGAFVGTSQPSVGARAISWDGSGAVLVDGCAGSIDAATLQSNGLSGFGWVNSTGMLFDPTTGMRILDEVSSDPMGVTYCRFVESGSGVGMPPDLGFSGGIPGTQGGYPAGSEAWRDPSTNEWLGVFCQRNTAGDCVLYTCRLFTPASGACGGPAFSNGPSVVQTQLYASASGASGFAFLCVAFDEGSVSHPIFAPGCTFRLNPPSTIVLGAFLPNFSGIVTGSTTVPVGVAYHELPLYFQWATLGFSGQIMLSEMRSAAVKQF